MDKSGQEELKHEEKEEVITYIFDLFNLFYYIVLPKTIFAGRGVHG